MEEEGTEGASEGRAKNVDEDEGSLLGGESWLVCRTVESGEVRKEEVERLVQGGACHENGEGVGTVRQGEDVEG